MAIIIRHGSNGGYKTAATVQDYLIPAIKQGRVVVTNIRGVSRDRALEVLPDDFKESHEVIYVDTATTAGKQKISTWFHWVPNGALLLFDEASSLFPKAWRDKDIKELDYPTGADGAAADQRPANWLEAWEMHRHYNWDIVLTTPNIKGIRDDIRNTTEMAFRHRNMATASSLLKGRFKEVQHDAVYNGTTPSQAITTLTRKIDKTAFKLYESTSTGQVKDTTAGKEIFNSLPLMVGLGVVACCFIYIVSNGGFALFDNAGTKSIDSLPNSLDSVPLASSSLGSDVSSPSPDNVYRRNVSDVKTHSRGSVVPLENFHIWLSGVVVTNARATVLFDVLMSESSVEQYTHVELESMGFVVETFNPCFAKITYDGFSRFIYCDAPIHDDETSFFQDGVV